MCGGDPCGRPACPLFPAKPQQIIGLNSFTATIMLICPAPTTANQPTKPVYSSGGACPHYISTKTMCASNEADSGVSSLTEPRVTRRTKILHRAQDDKAT